jgi:NAD(P)-dependent dehydrogenase (short-subunit alcohol dehydrogenase family)
VAVKLNPPYKLLFKPLILNITKGGKKMDLHLKDKVALVTGAGSQIGYGRKIATTLAEEGCDLIVADIDLDGAKQTAAQVEALGRQALAVRVDVTNRAEVDEMVRTALAKFGRIDILVNHAGASNRGGRTFVQMTKADWDFDINVNLYGQMNVAQAVLPHMIERKYGRIIFTSGGQGLPTLATYGAAKAGVEALTHTIASEVTSSGVFVNGIGPGLGQTGLTRGADPNSPHMQGYIQSSMLKRLCTPEDVAPVVAFLASDVCSYLTGQFIHLRTD